MIDRSQSETAEYSLFSSQVASNTLFYCTFNVKSAQYLVNCGVVEKMLNITKKLLDDEEGDFPLRLENSVKLFLFIFSNRFFRTILTDNSVCTSLYILSTSLSSVLSLFASFSFHQHYLQGKSWVQVGSVACKSFKILKIQVCKKAQVEIINRSFPVLALLTT